MLKFEEIKHIAFKGMPLPENANVLEITAHYALTLLFRDFKNEKITKAFATAQEMLLRNTYEKNAVKYMAATVMTDRYNALEQKGLVTAAEKNGCEICRDIVKILDGRMSSC